MSYTCTPSGEGQGQGQGGRAGWQRWAAGARQACACSLPSGQATPTYLPTYLPRCKPACYMPYVAYGVSPRAGAGQMQQQQPLMAIQACVHRPAYSHWTPPKPATQQPPDHLPPCHTCRLHTYPTVHTLAIAPTLPGARPPRPPTHQLNQLLCSQRCEIPLPAAQLVPRVEAWGGGRPVPALRGAEVGGGGGAK